MACGISPLHCIPTAHGYDGTDLTVYGKAGVIEKHPWPSTPAERARALRRILTQSGEPLSPEAAARHFHRAQRKQVASLLETFAALGIARKTDAAQYVM